MENPLIVLKLGCVDYGRAWRLQQLLVEARRRDELPDILVLTEHPPVITFGQGGGQESLCCSAEDLAAKGVGVYSVERGGQGTFHGPGQVVLYPILKWRPSLLHDLVGDLEQAVINTLRHYNITSDRDPSYPGIWCGEDKIAAVGLAFKKGVTSHGIALNVKTDLRFFNLFTPCGIRDKGVTSMQRLKAQQLDLEEVGSTLVQELATVLNRDYAWGFPEAPWLKVKVPPFQRFSYVWDIIQEEMLNTVCDSASCPNLGECFESGTATFLILGNNCTRRCAYCAVPKGRPQPVDPQEPLRLVRAAARLNLSHVVITSVTRDDLGDGGAGQFADCIVELRRSLPGTTVEVLVPDFRGSTAALQEVIAAGPHLFNHNVETVPRLYPKFRPGANYVTSLEILRYASQHGMRTKSGMMLGLGESRGEVLQVLTDLHNAGCELVTLGQYLRPNAENTPVYEYIHPQEFLWYRDEALRIGFKVVESGPLVRSSYQARESMLKQVT